jgi:hypothetical protein
MHGGEMTTIRIGEFEDSFVIHFGTEERRINAYTLASTLANLADAAKAANDTINPGYEIEIVVEAIGSGSFKAKISSYFQNQNNLFSGAGLKNIVLNIIASYIFIHTFQPDSKIEITVNSSEVVIEHEGEKIIVPRHVHDHIVALEKDERFTQSIAAVSKSVEEDEKVAYIGFARNMDDSVPQLTIPRERLQRASLLAGDEKPIIREITEHADVQILRAVLAKSKRRWQFSMGGIPISAPILHQEFYRKFAAHEITIAPGDSLKVIMRVKQRLSPGAGIYVNEAYEIIEVLDHIPRVVEIQQSMPT